MVTSDDAFVRATKRAIGVRHPLWVQPGVVLLDEPVEQAKRLIERPAVSSAHEMSVGLNAASCIAGMRES